MAKQKTANKVAAVLTGSGKPARRKRGKKHGRRWAQKLEGRIINTERKINHDDQGKPFPSDKPQGFMLGPDALKQIAKAIGAAANVPHDGWF